MVDIKLTDAEIVALHVFNDPQGTNEDAYYAIKYILSENKTLASKMIMDDITSCEGRFYFGHIDSAITSLLKLANK